MNKQTQVLGRDRNPLAEHARALMNATADVLGEQVEEARKRLIISLEGGKEITDNLREKSIKGSKAIWEAAHENPYQAIAIGVGVGALIAYLISRR